MSENDVTEPHMALITSAGGQLGIELQRRVWPVGSTVVPLGRNALELIDPAAIAAVVASRDWAAVINGAAYTAVFSKGCYIAVHRLCVCLQRRLWWQHCLVTTVRAS